VRLLESQRFYSSYLFIFYYELISYLLSLLFSNCYKGNADNLGNLIIKSFQNLKLLFLAGDKRRDTLPTILETHKVVYEELKVYETTLVDDIGKQIELYYKFKLIRILSIL